MSGATIPYHLRQNKIIDRYAFIELLLKISKILDISKYTYIGFGGHSLEDFKYIHSQFGVRNMISIEGDEQVYERQRFNMPISCIDSRNISSSEFVQNFIAEAETIIWLDYTNPSELGEQIQEFQSVLRALDKGDIVKITLNANPTSLLDQSSLDKKKLKQEKKDVSEELQKRRFEILEDRLGSLFPPSKISFDMMTSNSYPQVLVRILEYCSKLVMEERRGLLFQPLTAFSYADGQQMLTLTGIITTRGGVDEFLENTGFKGWELSQLAWTTPRRINIPAFTLKERLCIDSLLPDASVEDIHEKLGFYFSGKENISKQMLETYILFYKRSPLFLRVTV